jgi:NAD(P)-dependent dehydrogenase (short-subunit alcohol dehydrogenase family)
MADKAVLTTGANSGIGLATVIEVARRGFRSIGSVRSEEKAEVVAKAAADAGADIETVVLHVDDPASCEEVMADLSLYGLVNNAGYGLMGAIEDVSDEEAHALFETMVFAPMRLARLVLPGMRSRGEGRIINVSSIMGLTSVAFGGWYSGAKHALETLSDSLRVEVAGDGVKVVLIEPGGFKTNIWKDTQRDIAKHREAGSRYMKGYERSIRQTQLMNPIMGQPQAAAKTIASALKSSNPRARYLLGIDAQLLNAASRLTPTAIQDRVTRTILGL